MAKDLKNCSDKDSVEAKKLLVVVSLSHVVVDTFDDGVCCRHVKLRASIL
jgi:hypothetical protein